MTQALGAMTFGFAEHAQTEEGVAAGDVGEFLGRQSLALAGLKGQQHDLGARHAR
jgi:hypothetical protein